MPKKFPPLTLAEILTIMECWGFQLERQQGSHRQYKKVYKGRPYTVTVDDAIDLFGEDLIQKMIRQSGLPRELFYGGSKSAARKISCEPLKHAK